MSKNLMTVLLSILVSSVVSSIIGYEFAHRTENGTGRFSSIEILDANGKTRAVLGTTGANGIYVPQLIMGTDMTRPSVILTTRSGTDLGTLFFSSRTREGKVSVGYLTGSDAIDTRPQEARREDPFGAWGLRVTDQSGKNVSIGMLNTGTVVLPVQPVLK